jgi:hypothetical protein
MKGGTVCMSWLDIGIKSDSNRLAVHRGGGDYIAN